MIGLPNSYIDCQDKIESAKNALLKMNGKDIQGRAIKVDFDVK